MRKLLRLFGIVLPVVWLLVGTSSVGATSNAGTQNVAQSYNTDTSVRQGMIVGLKHTDNSKIVPLSSTYISDMLGVAISASEAPITLSNNAASAQVYVATSGRYSVLVSNQNGAIAIGTYVSVSSLDGIGMKATDSEPTVVGRAAGEFSGSNDSVGTATIKTKSGSQTVAIGEIPVDINIGANPSTGRGGSLPGFLSVAGSNIASKPVSAPRVYLSILILLLAAFIAGSILFSGIKGSLVSIGRNPLARKYITRALLQVVITSIIVFIIGLFGVYLLLRL